MICDVYFLRREGVALPKDRLLGMRGQLQVEPGRIQDAKGLRKSMTAKVLLHEPNYPGQAAAKLYGVTLTRLDARGFVLTGMELKMVGMGAKTFPQAWFCRPVSVAAPSPGEA